MASLYPPYMHYKLGDAAADTTVTDSGSGDNDGTSSTNTTNLSTTGKIGDCFDFDGSESVDIDVVLTDVASDTTGSIVFWMYADTTGGSIIAFGHDDGDDLLEVSYNSSQYIDVYCDNAFWQAHTANGSVTTETWHHIAVVQDGNAPRIYVDGTNMTLTYTDNTDTTKWIGGIAGLNNGRIACRNYNNSGNETFFNGKIDDIRYYKKALTPAEVKAIYNSGTGTEDSIITYTPTMFQPYMHFKLSDATDDGYGDNDGSDIDSPTYESGKVGNCANLDGDNDAINIDAVMADVKDDTQGTFAFWMKTDAAETASLVSFGDDDADNAFLISLVTDEIRCYCNSSFSCDTPASISTDTWYHIAVVQDGVACKIYIDAVNQTLTWDASTNVQHWIDDVTGLDDGHGRIGCADYNNSGDTSFFNGCIDDLRYYKYPLTADEIRALYNNGVGIGDSAPTVSAKIKTFTSTQSSSGINDNMIDQAEADTNNDSETTVYAGHGAAGNTIQRILIKPLELSDIPSSATIISAKLWLPQNYHVTDDAGNSDEQANIYEVKRNWVTDEATWNIYSTGNSWTTAGCGDDGDDYDSTVLGTTEPMISDLPSGDACYFVAICFNETGIAHIQDLVDGSESNNYGFIIRLTDEATEHARLYCTSTDYSVTAIRPYWEIGYEVQPLNQSIILL